MAMSNGIPVLAIIIETAVAISMGYLTVRGFMKYSERRRKPTLFLSFSFLFMALAVTSSATGKWIHYFANAPILSFDDGFIIIAYQMTAIANVFIMVFIDEVFLNWGSLLTSITGILNGVTVGTLIIMNDFGEELYSEALPIVIYHAVISLITFGLLAGLAIRESVNSEQQMPKVGFVLIGMYGIFVALVFVLFALDLLMPESYSPFYYAAWISAGVGVLCGYLGYIFPDWLKKLLKLEG